MRKLTTRGALFLLCFAPTWLPACASDGGESNVAEHFGEAQRANVARMIANPTAGEENLEPLDGLDARTAEDVMENFHREQTRSTESDTRSLIGSSGIIVH